MAYCKSAGDIENTRTEKWWKANRDALIEAVKDLPIIEETNIDKKILSPLKYRTLSIRRDSPYYVPVEIFKLIQWRHNEIGFIKGLMYSVSIGDLTVAKHVFAQCKNRVIRLKSKDSLDRFDTFWCMISSDIHVYRHQGTIDGAIKTNQYSSPEYALKNNYFLRVLLHGPENTNMPLICSVLGTDVENVPTWNPSINQYCPINRYEIHHSKYTSNTSYYLDLDYGILVEKVIEPSAYIRKWLYPDFTTQMVIELLSTVIISTGEHKAHHNLPMSTGGMDQWIQGFKVGAYKSIPYAWIDEQHYKEVLDWISANCPRVDISEMPSYDLFIKLHSTAS